ncbi:hypothetical protein D3C73_940210 [compost metagenome]
MGNLSFCRYIGCFAFFEFNNKGNFRALAFLAFYIKIATHLCNQFLRNAHAQTCAAIFARYRFIFLAKIIEQAA